MLDFKARMHKIRFPLRLRPIPFWGSLQRSPDPLTVFKGPIKGGQGKKEGRSRGEKGKGDERGGEMR